MASTQELVVEEEQIQPPRKMVSKPIYFMNRSLHKIGEIAVEQCFAGSVAQSNNSGGSCATSDVDEFKAWFEALKQVIAYLKENHTAKDGKKPLPDGQLDTSLALLVPTAYEKTRYRNACWKQPHLAVFNLVEILESHPDIELQSEIRNWDIIDRAVAGIASAIDYYFGDKVQFPQRQKLKGLNPPANFNYEVRHEPNAENPQTGVKDQPDTDPKAPQS